MTTADRIYSWDDEARLIVWPPDYPAPASESDLASCVRQALTVAAAEPPPSHVEIAHDSPGLIQMDEIRRMAADPSFPAGDPDQVTVDDLELGPMS